MTNNRKPVDEVRLSLSAAGEDDGQPLHIATEGSLNQLPTKHRPGWHRAPDPALYSRHEATPHKGRDYDAILRAAKKKPVGYYEDAPTGIKFGGQPLPSAGHGKDIDTPWPKCTKMAHSEEYHLWRTETEGIWFDSAGLKGVCGTPSFTCAMTECNRIEVSRAEMAGFLEAHGHKDVAAQLRGTPRDDVATSGGRVWMNRAPRHFTETCYEHWRAVLIDGKVCTRGAWNKPGVWSGEANDVPSLQDLESDSYPELFGPERDAILAECRKAMGI